MTSPQARRKLVELLRGTIEVRSEPAVGSSFVVTLPYSYGAADSRPAAGSVN